MLYGEMQPITINKNVSNNRSFIFPEQMSHYAQKKLDGDDLHSLGGKQRVKFAKEFSKLCLILYYYEFLGIKKKKSHLGILFLCLVY